MKPDVAKLRQTILRLAIEGKLVPQDPNDDPADKLLKLVEAERQKLINEGKISKAKSQMPVSAVVGPYGLPRNWVWVRLPSIVKISDKYSIKRGPFGSTLRKEFFVEEGYKVYEQKHAIKKRFDIGRYYVSEKKYNELKAFEVKPLDIIISCSGTIGETAEVPVDAEPGIMNQALLKLRLNQEVMLNSYFRIMFEVYFRQTSTVKDAAGVAIKNITSVDNLKKVPMPLPPFSEQKRIVAKVDEMMALCDELEGKSDNFLETLTKLRQTILQLAVEGKLVPQDSSDEPASKLLRQIEAEQRKFTGKIHKSQVSPHISDDEKPFEIPGNWEWLRLGNAGAVKTGKTPPTYNRSNYGGTIGFIGPGQISKSRVNGVANTVSEAGLNYTATARPSSTLMVCIGGSIGKSVLIEEELAFNQQINSISPYSQLDDKFVYYVLNSGYFLQDLHNKSSGAATPIINLGKWTKILVPFPPIQEQERIVAKIDELMSLCDELESKLSLGL